MIKLKEANNYQQFMYDEMLIQKVKLQESLGFGRVREVVLRDEPVGELSDLEVEHRKQANELASKFTVLDLRGYDGDVFSPWDDLLVVDHTPIPVFESRQYGGYHGGSSRDNSFQTKRAQINEIFAENIGCEPIDFVVTPPEWALIKFPKDPCKRNCLALQMDDDIQTMFKCKLTDDEAKKMIRANQRWSYSEYLERVLANTPEFQQCRDRLLQDVTLEWIAGIPLFPSTALELAGRVKKISNDVTFMLLFQPEWEYKQIEMPKLDPVLIVWQPIDDCGNEGIWLRVCEWGRDVMELDENE